MKRYLRIFSAAVILTVSVTSCDDFPAFEGTYIGKATITSQIYDFPIESDATIVIERDFKDINISYTTVFGSFGLGGRITNTGIFTVTGGGTNDAGNVYSMTDVGEIDFTTGAYQSVLTIIEEGEITIIASFDLVKR